MAYSTENLTQGAAISGFISYSSQQSAWVSELQANLERCGWNLFLDQLDLVSGRSWVQQLQAGIDVGRRLVLVTTPDSLASPRVMDEWGGFIAAHPEWKQLGLLQVVWLLWAPMPPFLQDVQAVDFRGHDTAGYRQRLAELLAGLAQVSPRSRPSLPAGITVPVTPRPALEDRLRGDLVDLLVPWLADEGARGELARRLGVDPSKLAGFPSLACAASAALLLAGEKQDPRGTAEKVREAARARILDAQVALKLERVERALSVPGGWAPPP